MAKVPDIRFYVSKHVNLFYHVCVLFFEYFPDEHSLGILNSQNYRQQYQDLKTENLHKKFQKLWEYSHYTWDFVGKTLHEANTMASAKETLKTTSQNLTEIWLEILSMALPSYESIWAQIEAKLQKYKSEFETQWNTIHKSVLTKMSKITKMSWNVESINVHFVDCVHGASAWVRDIVLPPFPIIDVEKKLLAHEIAHILVPEYFLRTKLQNLSLDWTISHTLVDLIAYFGVKEHVADPERHGIKPNPNYYVQVSKLYPIFEECYENPDKYQSFDEIFKQIKL
jgi:hypothetical protein